MDTGKSESNMDVCDTASTTKGCVPPIPKGVGRGLVGRSLTK